MNKFFSLIPIIFLPLVSFAQQWKNFTDTAGKFTAKYPSHWVNKIKEGNRVFFTSPADSTGDSFFENINISVSQHESYGTTIKIKDLFPTVTDGIKKQFTDFKDEGVRYFKWNNADAAEIIYSGHTKTDESLNIRSIQWYCFYKSRLYVVTFVAAEDNNTHDATARQIMTGIIFK